MTTELEYERTIIEAAQMLGYRVHSERTAWSRGKYSTPIKGDAGWPDLVIAGHGRVFVVELKRRPNKVTADQQAWIDALADAGVCTGVVHVPEGQQKFVDLLAEFTQKERAS